MNCQGSREQVVMSNRTSVVTSETVVNLEMVQLEQFSVD